MTELLRTGVPGTFLLIVVVFGFAPGFILRLLVKVYPREHPRRAELVAQIYLLPRWERPLYVAEQCETVLFEGLPHRVGAWRRRRGAKRAHRRIAGEQRIDLDRLRSIARKITIATTVGATSFPLTDMIFAELGQQLATAVGVGAVVVLVQVLVDFEKRLFRAEQGQASSVNEIQGVVERGFAKVNHATRLFAEVEEAGRQPVAVTELVRHAAGFSSNVPSLARAFARAEIDRISEFLRELADLHATHEGADREWLLGLTRSAAATIDAISIPTVDAAGNAFHSFWESDLGRRYLDLQREAVQRGVRVRRILVTERDEIAGDLTLQRICRMQADLGIDARLLVPSAIRSAINTPLFDFIVFDNTLSYEVTPAASMEHGASPMILHTRLVLRGDKVRERIDRYTRIWASAVPWVNAEF